MGYDLTQQGIQPQLRQLLEAQAKFNAEDIAIVILGDATATPEPTDAVWSYTKKFEMQTAAGEVIPYTGNIVAAATDTSSAGTAAVDDASPAMVMGQGTVTLSGDVATWADAETATLTLTYTTAYGNDKTDTFVVTFTA